MSTNTSVPSVNKILKHIDQTGYFTNHGPMAKAFEKAIANAIGQVESVAVSHFFVAALMAPVGLEVPLAIKGRKDQRLLAALTILDAKQCNDRLLKPDSQTEFYCLDLTNQEDVNQIQKSGLESKSKDNTRNIIFILNPFDHIDLVRELTAKNFACILSHEGEEKLSTFSGASILSTNPDFLHIMRNIRSSYGVQEQLKVAVTSNGRFAETQAFMGLEKLETLGFQVDY